MGTEAFIIALYGPNIVSCLLVAFLYMHWRRAINHMDDVNNPTKDLLSGIFFTFCSQFFGGMWALVAHVLRAPYLNSLMPATKVSEWMFNFAPAVMMINFMLFIGAAVHLHAYWQARYGRSFVWIWVVMAAVWYGLLAWLFF